MSLTWAPGRQQTSLRGGAVQLIGLSVHLRRESPTTMTRLFFFVEAVVILQVGLMNLERE